MWKLALGITLALIVSCKFFAVVMIHGTEREKWEADRRAHTEADLRADNEILASAWLGTVEFPKLKADPGPSDFVKPSALVESFLGDGKAYVGRRVIVPVMTYIRDGNAILWRFSVRDEPAIRFELDKPPEKIGCLWVIGTVKGIERDGHGRSRNGIDFCVVVTGCRVAE